MSTWNAVARQLRTARRHTSEPLIAEAGEPAHGVIESDRIVGNRRALREVTRSSQSASEKTTTAALAQDDGLSAFLSVRPRLFGIAYRMLGSAGEAEDVVQDAWVRWQTVDRRVVRDAGAFLVTSTVRLSLNVLQSARLRRETYVRPGLPEPVDRRADPRLGAERSEALRLGIRLLLEKLTPTERAAYILREAFDYSYSEIANVLRLEQDNARQVVTRARRHVADGRRAPANPTECRRLLDAFVAAARSGELSGLEGLLVFGCGRRRSTLRAATTHLGVRSMARGA